MRFLRASQVHTFRYEFRDDGEIVVPDVASVSWTLFDNDGTSAPANTNQLVTTDGTTNSVQLVTQQGDNIISTTVEKRTVIIRWSLNGASREDRFHYWLTNLIDITVTENDVRAILGVQSRELPDASIDLVSSYFDVDADMNASLAAVLIIGTSRAIKANKAIALRAAIDCLPGLRLSVAQKEASDTISYARYSEMDWAALRTELANQYAEALLDADDTDIPDLALLTLATPTDPITGT